MKRRPGPGWPAQALVRWTRPLVNTERRCECPACAGLDGWCSESIRLAGDRDLCLPRHPGRPTGAQWRRTGLQHRSPFGGQLPVTPSACSPPQGAARVAFAAAFAFCPPPRHGCLDRVESVWELGCDVRCAWNMHIYSICIHMPQNRPGLVGAWFREASSGPTRQYARRVLLHVRRCGLPATSQPPLCPALFPFIQGRVVPFRSVAVRIRPRYP